MKLEIDFHGSEISDIKTGKNELEIIFSHADIVQAGGAPRSKWGSPSIPSSRKKVE